MDCPLSLLRTDICHDLLNLYNDQDQEAAPREVSSKQAATAAATTLPPPPSVETVPNTLAGQPSLPAMTLPDVHAQHTDQQQSDPPPLPPPPGTYEH